MNNNYNNKAVILLSGGIDSYVSLDIAQKSYDIKLALTFNYGQKAFLDELCASKQIALHYNIEHKTLELPFLKEISKNALTDKDNDNFNDFSSVWIPNRNGLFLNIAACFCDKFDYQNIIIGMNLEEGESFPDNTLDFKTAADNFFKFSTLNGINVVAPCINFKKLDIVNYAIENDLNFKYIKSCYKDKGSNKKHCGKCLSCNLLLNALKKANREDIIKEIF